MAVMPFASMARSPCVGAVPAVTETILPPRTMIVPDSITCPLPTITRALVMATSCAAAGSGAIHPTRARHAGTIMLFITLHLPESFDATPFSEPLTSTIITTPWSALRVTLPPPPFGKMLGERSSSHTTRSLRGPRVSSPSALQGSFNGLRSVPTTTRGASLTLSDRGATQM